VLLLVMLEGLSYREVGRHSGCADRNRDVAPRPRPRHVKARSRANAQRFGG